MTHLRRRINDLLRDIPQATPPSASSVYGISKPASANAKSGNRKERKANQDMCDHSPALFIV
jgi:hypothetical protein